MDRQGIASLAVGEESFGPRGLVPTSEPDLSGIPLRGPNLPAAAAILAAGMVPGSGVAEAAGALPGSPSLSDDVSKGNYLDALLKGIGVAGDAAYMTPATAPLGAAAKAALAIPASIRAFHLSPKVFTKFDSKKAGSGQTALSGGSPTIPGVYLADNRDSLKTYLDTLGDKSDSFIYNVKIDADPPDFLDFDLPLNKQSEKVQKILKTFSEGDSSSSKMVGTLLDNEKAAGADLIGRSKLDPELLESLKKEGIEGVSYNARGADRLEGVENPDRNYVVFNEELLDIVSKQSTSGENLRRSKMMLDYYGDQLPLTVNPSKKEIEALVGKTKYKALRRLVDPDSGNVYVWDAGAPALHFGVAENLGIRFDEDLADIIEVSSNFRKGGEVPIPRTVDDHFLSYINPQEASALRAMGGGITASGGQRMMNGIPSFSPQDQAAGDRAASTDMPDDVDDPHGVGQPTSQNPMGGVPGVDDTAYDKAIRDLEEKAKETPKEKAERERRETLSKMSLVDALTHGLQNLQGRIGIAPLPGGFSVPADLGLPGFFGGLASEPSDPSDESSQAESNLQKGGEVKVPEKVSGHFLAYINPQEAAMLRGAGGGITALGGQKMRNGIPIFDNPQDDEGQGGAPASPSTGTSAPAGSGFPGEDAAIAEQQAKERDAANMADPSFTPAAPPPPGFFGGIMSFAKNPVANALTGLFGVDEKTGRKAQAGINAVSMVASALMGDLFGAGRSAIGLGIGLDEMTERGEIDDDPNEVASPDTGD